MIVTLSKLRIKWKLPHLIKTSKHRKSSASRTPITKMILNGLRLETFLLKLACLFNILLEVLVSTVGQKFHKEGEIHTHTFKR